MRATGERDGRKLAFRYGRDQRPRLLIEVGMLTFLVGLALAFIVTAPT